MSKFKIHYDDELWDVVWAISALLATHGLTIDVCEEGDGYMEYEIKRVVNGN